MDDGISYVINDDVIDLTGTLLAVSCWLCHIRQVRPPGAHS